MRSGVTLTPVASDKATFATGSGEGARPATRIVREPTTNATRQAAARTMSAITRESLCQGRRQKALGYVLSSSRCIAAPKPAIDDEDGRKTIRG